MMDSDRPADATDADAESSPDASAVPPRAPRRRRRIALRTLRLLAALFIVALLAAWWTLESDAAADRMRRWLESRGTATLGAPVRIGRLALDVLPFHLELHDVRVGLPQAVEPAVGPQSATGPGAETPPAGELLASVDRLALDLSPWGLIDNRIVVLNLELERPLVRLDLPFGVDGRTAGAGPLGFEVRRMRVTDGRLAFAHRVLRIEGELEGIRLRLAPESEGLFVGPFAAGLGELRVAGGRLDLTDRNGPDAVLSPVEVRSVFGVRRSGVRIDELALVAGESRVEARGTVAGTDTAELAVTADLAIDDVEKIWRPRFPGDNGGRLRFNGNLEMRAGDPVLAGRVAGDDLRIGGLPIDAISTDLLLHSEQIALRNLDASLLGGRVAGSVLSDTVAEPARIRVDYTVAGLDAALLTRWEVLDGWRFAGRVDATGELEWQRPFAETVRGTGTLQASLPGGGTLDVARRLADSMRGQTVHPPEPGPTREPHESPALPIPVDMDLRYRIAPGAVDLESSELRLKDTTIRAEGRVEPAGEVRLAARIASDDLRMLDHLLAQLRAATGTAAPVRLGLHGSGIATVELNGSASAPVVTGTIEGRGVGVRGLQVGTVAASLRPGPGMLVLDPVRITRSGGSVTGSARFTLDADSAYEATLLLDRYDLAAEPELNGRDLPLRAVVSGRVSLSGAGGGLPAAGFDLEAAELAVANLQLGASRAAGSIDSERWTLDTFEARGLGGSLRGSGSWAPGSRVLDAELAIDEVDMAAASITAGAATPFVGRLSADARFSGPLEALDGDASLRWREAEVGALPLGTVVASANIEGGVATIHAAGDPAAGADLARATPRAAFADLDRPESGWALAATTDTSAPFSTSVRIETGAEFAAVLLEQLGQPLPPGVTFGGSVEVVGDGSLSAPASWTATASVDAFRLEQPPDFLLTSERIVVELSEGRLLTSAVLTSGVGPFRVQASGDLTSGALDGSVVGTIDAAALRLWEEALSAAGTAEVSIDLGGRLDSPEVSGRVSVTDFALDRGWKYPVSDVDAELRLRGERVFLESLTGLLGGNPVAGSGVVPLTALLEGNATSGDLVELDLQVSRLPIGPVLEESEALSALVSDGAVSADVHVEGRGLSWREYGGHVTIRALEIRMRDYDWALEGTVEAPLDGGRVVFPEGTRVVGTRTGFGLTGHVELAPLRLDLAVNGRVGLEPLNVLSELWGTGGTALADLRVFGPVRDLQFRGTAALENVVLSPPPLRQPIENIDAQVIFEDRRIRVTEARGELGGGPLVGSGELFLRDNKPQSFRFVTSVDNALLRLEREVRVRASADVVLDGTPERSLLSGSVRLLEGRYRRDLEADDAILEILEAPETDPDPLLTSIRLDLQVDGERGLLIDNNLAQVEVTADFQVGGSLAEPILLGRSVILDGELYWNDNVFEVLQGAVEFNNPFRTELFFEIRARTDIRRYTVSLNFSGSFERGIAFDYSSTPTLSDLDLFNLLAFGEEPDSAVFQDPYAYQQALGLQATRYLTDAYLAEVERGAARLFGVDRFRIAPTLTGSETDATARLTIGKRLNSDLYVTYSRLLSNSEEQLLTVEYELSSTIRLKGTRDEDGSFGIDFLVQKRIR